MACLKCPEGGSCEGFIYAPTNRAGFWGDGRELSREAGADESKALKKLAYYECEDGKEACRKDYECAPGLYRRLCVRIKPLKYFRVGDASPIRCPRTMEGRWLLGCFMILAVGAAWYFFNFYLLGTYVAIDQLTYFMQARRRRRREAAAARAEAFPHRWSRSSSGLILRTTRTSAWPLW